MSTKTPKPRVMWAAYYHTPPRCQPTLHRSKAEANKWTGVARSIRVAVIPLDDLAGITERARSAFWGSGPQGTVRDIDGIRAALTAAGIPCKRKARK